MKKEIKQVDEKHCSRCHLPFVKKSKQSYKQFENQEFCSKVCKAKELKSDNFSNWKGGKRKSGDYVQIYTPYHPYARNGYVMEHRLVMERKLKRFILPSEHVHHKNGIKNDNRLSNLEVLDGKEHNRLHAKETGLGKKSK